MKGWSVLVLAWAVFGGGVGYGLVFFDVPEHHGVDEICAAFPADGYPRPLTYTVSRPDGKPLATGGCQ